MVSLPTACLNATNWTALPRCHFTRFLVTQFVNKEEFIVIPWNNTKYPSDGIYKYNLRLNAWIKILNHPDYFEFQPHTIAYDEEKRVIYIQTINKTNLFEIDLHKIRLNESKLCRDCIDNVYSAMIVLNGELNVICGTGSNKHYIWDNERKKCNEIYQFNDHKYSEGLIGHRLIYLKSKNNVLLFGGHFFGSNSPSDSIYRFCVVNKEWNKLSIKMPQKLHSFGIVTTRYNRYVIILGGYDGASLSDDILVFNTQNFKFHRSNIKCPKKANYYAIITNDIEGDNLLTAAYINNCYKLPMFAHLQHLPFYMVELIAKWVCNQTIYLLKYGNYGEDDDRSENIWKIDVDHIF